MDVTVEWRASRWPALVARALALLGVAAADQGTLLIRAAEPGALGRLTLEDAQGRILCFLIDGRADREKVFHPPVPLAGRGFRVKDERGQTLFALNCGAEAEREGAANGPPAEKPEGKAAQREADAPANASEREEMAEHEENESASSGADGAGAVPGADRGGPGAG